ncbi:MAG TPA: crosslink repair DNA glycosylase YcaQ family protein [Acidimicrobiia bacterium]|nr:crosslink repair DNA glycosylase YcaQ family protein [Acidimicrobiia bacterium]
MTDLSMSVEEVRRFRFHRHELDRDPAPAGKKRDAAFLDYGVQDTGPDGAAWALAIRGTAISAADLIYAWTLRGAPHAYRRADVDAIAVATAPLSEADAGKRIFDANKPLRAAGIPALEALRTLAGHQRRIVRAPTVKGDVSSRLTELVDEPYLRSCRPCNAIHVYENPFRMAALQGGLELEPGTSPPVLHRIPGFKPPLYRRLGDTAEPRFDVVRNYLRFYGPATIRDAAEFIDAPPADIKQRWPDDTVEVQVRKAGSSGRAQPRFVLAEDADALADPGPASSPPALRLLGPFDPYLQLRDREVLASDSARRKALWPMIGRPGAAVADGEVLALWRPRTSGKSLRLAVEPWRRLKAAERTALEEQAEGLAAHRGVALAGLSYD